MVGGYIISTKSPIKFGENNMVAMYGSLQAANDRLIEVASSKKPILVYLEVSDGTAPHWFEYGGVIDGVLTLVSQIATITYSATTGILRLIPKD